MENVFLVHQTSGKIYPLSLEKENIIERGGGDKETPGWIMLPDPTVSRLHAKIYLKDNQIFLENLSTRNGTLCNGKKIDSPVLLKHGDKITVGKSDLVFYENFIAGETQEIRLEPEIQEEKASRFPGIYIHAMYAGVVLVLALVLVFLATPVSPVPDIEKEKTIQTAESKEKEAPQPVQTTPIATEVPKAPETKAPETKVTQVSPSPEPVFPLQTEGFVQIRKTTEVVSPWEARVNKIMVDKGFIVEQGQALASFDLTRLQDESKVYLMELQVTQKESQFLQEQMGSAEKKYRQIQSLYSQKLESQQNYQKAQDDLQSIKSRLDASLQKQKLAQLRCEQIQARLSQNTLLSPHKGIVVEKIVKEGDMIQANTVLFQIARMEDIVVSVEFPASFAKWILPKQRVLLSPSEKLGKKYRGLVESMESTPSALFVKIGLLNADGSLLPVSKIHCKFLTQTSKQ